MFNRLSQRRFASTQRVASIPQTILDQLGGGGLIKMMTGAKQFVGMPNGLQIHIPRSPKGVAVIKIELSGKDLYDLTFYGQTSPKTFDRKIKSTENDVYAEELRETIEQHTGLILVAPRFR